MNNGKYSAFASKRKAETTIGDYWISTVFIQPEACYDGNPFETMILNKKTDEWLDYQERCVSDWKTQHEDAVEFVKMHLVLDEL